MSQQPVIALPMPQYLDLTSIEAALQSSTTSPLSILKNALDNARVLMDEDFDKGADIRNLIYGRAWVMDQIIGYAWQQFSWSKHTRIALVAVGGYGRGELHPYSDIDILVLSEHPLDKEDSSHISEFLAFLWDLKLDIGSSVRTLEHCFEFCKKDITIATNLLESRTICGDLALQQTMLKQITSDAAWTAQEFFLAKLKEQQTRHESTHNTEYNLEPNLKSSPGGLRDIQTIGWVAKRHFGSTYLRDLIHYGFLTESELQAINQGEHFLWTIRYALHKLTKRREDRLLFDHQRALAKQFNYTDNDHELAVEQFMRKYYLIAKTVSEFNDLLLQYFDESILRESEDNIIETLNSRFQIHNHYLEAKHAKVFIKQPFALMEVFVLMAQHPHIRGVRAATIRLIREHKHLINEQFRQDLRNTSLFMELLRTANGVSTQLTRMNRYGILGLYLPEFGQVIGQMQHDLFHIYTVDAHTLKVIQMMRQFRHENKKDTFPLAHRIINQLPKIELLYIAGLYHDIAKGRGGDHSELGAEDVIQFCQRHHISKWDTQLVAWLVKNHLTMSITAQRKDISDPDIIFDFANRVRDLVHLNYLYVLTVADINATNHSLWNSWRGSLLGQLYSETKRALRRGLENPVNREDLIEQVQTEAKQILKEKILNDKEIDDFWDKLGEDYFLRETPQNIAWHTQKILEHRHQPLPLIAVHKTAYRLYEGATEIFIYSDDLPHFFPATVAALDQMHLNVVDARIMATEHGQTLSTYTVLDEQNQPLADNHPFLQTIQEHLIQQLKDSAEFSTLINRRVSRVLKLFPIPTQVNLNADSQNQYSVLEVITSDRPGLLARLGRIFLEFDIYVRKAKISNIGERVEDFFFISDANGNPLQDAALIEAFKSTICSRIDSHIHRENE